MQTKWKIGAPSAPNPPETAPPTKHSRSFTGCIRCKRMKVKCDEKRPSCTRCTRRNQQCIYTQKISVFYPRDSANGESTWSAKAHSISPEQYRPPLPTPTYLLNPAQIEQAYAQFFGSKGPSEYYGSSRWIPMLIELPDKSSSLSLSMAAVTFNRLGWKHQSLDFEAEAKLYYHRALMSVQKELMEPDHTFNEQTLASLHLLSMYEGMSGSSFLTIIAHVMGMTSYITTYASDGDSIQTTDLTAAILVDSLDNHLGKVHTLGRVAHEDLKAALQRLVPKKENDIDQLTVQLGMRRGAAGIRALMQIAALTSLPTNEFDFEVEMLLDSIQDDIILSYRMSELACALSAETPTGSIVACVDFASRTMADSRTAETLIRLIQERGYADEGYVIRPVLQQIGSEEYRVEQSRRLKKLWPQLKSDSAMASWHGHCQLKSLIWPGRGGSEDENGHLDVSDATGLRAANLLTNNFRHQIWGAGGERRWDRVAMHTQDNMSSLWDDDCIAESERLVQMAQDHKLTENHLTSILVS